VLVCTAVSVPLIVGAVVAMRPSAEVRPTASASVVHSMQEGFSFVWRDPVIRPLFGLLVLVSILARPLTQLLPAVAANHLRVGPVELSWLLGATGAGALIGSILSASLGGFRRRGLLVVVSSAASGLLLLGFALQASLTPSLALVSLASIAIQAHVTNHVTVYQIRAPDRLRGRVVGVSSMLAQTSIALGTLALGALGTLVGIEVALALAGATVAGVSVLIVARFPALRRFGQDGFA
jgi:hypothetical protein